MEERLIVKNFGPLKDVDIPLKDVMVFIGPQGSGKSTIAKLLALVCDDDFVDTKNFQGFLKRFNINWTNSSTFFEYSAYPRGFILKDGINYYNGIAFGFSVLDYERVTKDLFIILEQVENIRNGTNKSGQLSGLIISCLRVFSDALSFLQDEFLHHQKVDEKNNLDVKFATDNFNRDEQLLIYANNVQQWISTCLRVEIHQLVSVSILQQFDEKIRGILDIFHLMNRVKNSIYVPAERTFLPLVAGSFFTLIKNKVPISNSIISFGAEFENARTSFPEYEDDILGVKYVHTGFDDRIYFTDSESIPLNESASGIQALLPMKIVIDALLLEKDKSYIFIIEEPELNLYPSAQKKLVDFLVRKCAKGNNKLIITTHSPYILTALNNHIEAVEAAKNEKVSDEEVEKIMPKESWLDFDRVGAWYVDKGTCRDIMDKEGKLIVADNIDDVSTQINEEFDSLMHLKYRE